MAKRASKSTQTQFASAEQNGTSRSRWVYDNLRAAIQAGQYVTGQRVREEQIAQLLGVSRTPVREALSRLQAVGLIENVAGGLVIAELTRSQINELFALREILEGSAARFAAQHAAPSEIASLRHIADVFKKSFKNPAELAAINRKFHNAIYVAAHNRYQMRTLNELQDTLALLPGTTFTVAGRPEQAAREHGEIIDAIEKRDADEAERLARLHIRHAQNARLTMIFQE
jgi:DNA-binding GntR family transcriptional regulator